MSVQVNVTNLSEDRQVRLQILRSREDGREQVPNGEYLVEPGADKTLLIDDETSVRVSMGAQS